MNYEGNKRTRTSKKNRNGERGGDFAQLGTLLKDYTHDHKNYKLIYQLEYIPKSVHFNNDYKIYKDKKYKLYLIIKSLNCRYITLN